MCPLSFDILSRLIEQFCFRMYFDDFLFSTQISTVALPIIYRTLQFAPAAKVCRIDGAPGAGKSTRAPIELLGSLMEIYPQSQHGVAVIMDLKEAQNTLFGHLQKQFPNSQEWVTIWNGDPDGHRWPRQQSFMVLSTPRSFFHRMLLAESTQDVQHLIYDEVHDASPWTLFLLSHHLYELSQGVRMKLYLMTATPDTPIFSAVQQAVAEALHGSPILEVAVPPPPGTEQRRRSSREIPRHLLPENFDQLPWQKQTCHCIDAIILWATSQNMSAAILVLVPGDQEMQQVIASWLSAPGHRKIDHNIFRVSSRTTHSERTRTRYHLVDQGCKPGRPHSIVVATKVFESSITLHINGVINTGMAMGIDRNGHLKVFLCSAAEATQRVGRAGRVFDSLFKSLHPSDLEQPASHGYELPKHEALPLVLGAVSLGKSFPIIGIVHSKLKEYYAHLEHLALIQQTSSGQYALTCFGHEVRQQGFDLRSGILATICARFDLAWHGRIAAAYIEAQSEVFLTREFSSTCGLYPDQLALAHHTGFLCPERPTADAGDVDVADSEAAPSALDDARDHADSSIAPRVGDDAPAAPSLQKSEMHTATHELNTQTVSSKC